MTVSVFDLFKVGIGPSSSHTVGPMKAAHLFADGLRADDLLPGVARVHVELFGSLGATGHGHGSVKAVVLGLAGEQPHLVDPVAADPMVQAVLSSGSIELAGEHPVPFSVDDVVMHRRKRLEFHINGMVFQAFDAGGAELQAARVLLGRRRLRARRGRRRQPAAGGRRDARAPPLHHGRRAARHHPGDGPADQRRDARQRARPADRGRGAPRAAGDLAGDAGVRRARQPDDRRAARGPEGTPACGRRCGPGSRSSGRPGSPTRWGRWSG